MIDHKAYIEVKSTSYCGDHYCTGHNEKILKCACGFEAFAYDEAKKTYKKHLFNMLLLSADIQANLDDWNIFG